jgi:hypothetical protein
MATEIYSQINRIGVIVDSSEDDPQIQRLEEVKCMRLVLTDLCGKSIFEADAPPQGWCFKTISEAIAHIDTSDVTDMRIGGVFIGSTEL